MSEEARLVVSFISLPFQVVSDPISTRNSEIQGVVLQELSGVRPAAPSTGVSKPHADAGAAAAAHSSSPPCVTLPSTELCKQALKHTARKYR